MGQLSMAKWSQICQGTIIGTQFQVQVSTKARDPCWDAFVAKVPGGHHAQTSLWGQVKNALSYRTVRVIASKDGRIVAGGQLFIRQLMPFVSIAYMSKGPILPTWDPSLARIIIDELKRVAQTNHLLVIALQPPNNDLEFGACLADHGFRPSWLELAPTATILIDLTQETDQILGQMKRQTRQKIRRSEREGITTREGTEADLPAFYQLHVMTSQRQRFTPYPEEYFARMWQVFSEQDLISLIMAEYQNTPVSAVLLVAFGNMVVGNALGWSGEHGKRRPTDAVLWAALQWAKAHGYHCFDMGGIDREGAELTLSGQSLPEALRRTPDTFKLGYGGSVILLPQSYYFVPSLLWRWPYSKIFGLKGRSPAIQETFERYRRRFG